MRCKVCCQAALEENWFGPQTDQIPEEQDRIRPSDGLDSHSLVSRVCWGTDAALVNVWTLHSKTLDVRINIQLHTHTHRQDLDNYTHSCVKNTLIYSCVVDTHATIWALTKTHTYSWSSHTCRPLALFLTLVSCLNRELHVTYIKHEVHEI